jgi:hypothetical protein
LRPVGRQRVFLVRNEGTHHEKTARQLCKSSNELVTVAANRREVGDNDIAGEFVGHRVQRQSSVQSDAHGEMAPARGRRGVIPDDAGASLKNGAIPGLPILGFAHDLSRSKGALKRFVKQARKISPIGVERLDEAEHRCIQPLDQMR